MVKGQLHGMNSGGGSPFSKNSCVLVMMDYTTRYCVLRPIKDTSATTVPLRYLNSGYPGNRGIFPKAAHAHTINAMMHFLGFPERVVADNRRHKYEASGCGSHK